MMQETYHHYLSCVTTNNPKLIVSQKLMLVDFLLLFFHSIYRKVGNYGLNNESIQLSRFLKISKKITTSSEFVHKDGEYTFKCK